MDFVSCGSFLDHYDFTDRVAVGRIGAMTDIVEMMASAPTVITV